MTSDSMTTAADLEALAQRVEREEPSWELDVAVARTIDPTTPLSKYDPHIARYTSSLDATASLVPSGWWLEELRSLPDGRVYAFLADKEGGTESTAPTEPRARTAAALRAMAVEMNDE